MKIFFGRYVVVITFDDIDKASPPWAGGRKRIGPPPLPSVSYEATKRGHLRSIDALVTLKSVYPSCLP